jgi:predicted phosphodiesterase
MRLWIMSDVHLEVNRRRPFVLPDPRPPHEAVIIAGDIMAGMADAVRWIADQGLNERPVVYVGGNHEFYGDDRHTGLADGMAEASRHRNIHILEQSTITIAGVLIAGATLWTDYTLFGDASRAMAHAAHAMRDHTMIRLGQRRWTPRDAAAEHVKARASIARALDQHGSGKSVIVTHHAPSRRSASARYQDDVLTAAFATDCEVLAGRATVWIHGHMHNPADYRLGGCRVIANPRGYVGIGEAAEFLPDLVVDV